ncbi:uncharacterized protein F4812DRAFT_456090 [Daldinia caldariorum]|uniref:uncharacterized protein n=1 Tax=Daldinia caldariorum TaxID=326644 RepID=UPI0020084E07|nr:uncharacterized protein F4812DRAFT_456090 [Daldinia caldariorum]KAI1471990.1 hypothetical protein F4812DRAFT_456090 [Daldinia caldariorum]
MPQYNTFGDEFPIVPDYEITGTIAAVGDDVKGKDTQNTLSFEHKLLLAFLQVLMPYKPPLSYVLAQLSLRHYAWPTLNPAIPSRSRALVVAPISLSNAKADRMGYRVARGTRKEKTALTSTPIKSFEGNVGAALEALPRWHPSSIHDSVDRRVFHTTNLRPQPHGAGSPYRLGR